MLSDLITDRLNTALTKEKDAVAIQDTTVVVVENEVKIETTNEEIEGFMIVKTILRQKIDSKRISYRDGQTYFAILLDDNNRKTICRLYLNGTRKFIAVLDENKKEIKSEIETLDDIFKLSQKLTDVVDNYEKR